MNEVLKTIKALEDRVALLEGKLTSAGIDVSAVETIRDTVFFDIDNTTTYSKVISIGAGGGSANVFKDPDTYIRAYFRGKPGNVPFFYLT